MQAQEQIQLAELASESRIKEQKLAGDQDSLRREEQLELARIARQRREQTENLATQRQALELEQERLHAQLAVDEDRVNAEAPVRLLRIEKERGILAEELELRHLQNQVKTLDVERDLLLPRAQQDLRREMLPLEQAPQMVGAASRVLQGTNLSIYGENSQLVGQLAPIFELLTRAVTRATQAAPERAQEPQPEAAGAEV